MAKLDHFTEWEFGKWWGQMRPEILRSLDHFREYWGPPVIIRFKWDGPHVAGRLGRTHGPDGTSDHNIDRWGEVRAVDCFPQGMNDRQAMERAISIAERVGFNALGIYPDARPSPMIHLGQRPDASRTAMWGALRSEQAGRTWDYVATVVALEQIA